MPAVLLPFDIHQQDLCLNTQDIVFMGKMSQGRVAIDKCVNSIDSPAQQFASRAYFTRFRQQSDDCFATNWFSLAET
jgi:hypothetical protein